MSECHDMTLSRFRFLRPEPKRFFSAINSHLAGVTNSHLVFLPRGTICNYEVIGCAGRRWNRMMLFSEL